MKRLLPVLLLSCGLVGSALSHDNLNIYQFDYSAPVKGTCEGILGASIVGLAGGVLGYGANIFRNRYCMQPQFANRYVSLGFLMGTGLMGLINVNGASQCLRENWSSDPKALIIIGEKKVSVPTMMSHLTAFLVSSAGMVGVSTWGLVRMVLRK